MADEAGVDHGDALGAGHGRYEGGGVLRTVGYPHVEAQRPQIALERRSGYRRTGEDGGRQTNSLLGAEDAGARRPARQWGGGASAEAIR
jgi:hypothetical protein